ncbi:hypothetical protein BH23PLA1_BH23PLA1_00530 [soil metagenome]
MNASLKSPTVRCPTCRAVQDWAESCRRCQSDLGLLVEVAGSYRHHRQRCLQLLESGHPQDAIHHARQCHRLHPDKPSRRLLAVCALLVGDWVAATSLARRLPLVD